MRSPRGAVCHLRAHEKALRILIRRGTPVVVVRARGGVACKSPSEWSNLQSGMNRVFKFQPTKGHFVLSIGAPATAAVTGTLRRQMTTAEAMSGNFLNKADTAPWSRRFLCRFAERLLICSVCVPSKLHSCSGSGPLMPQSNKPSLYRCSNADQCSGKAEILL